jgi:hypothetical protein
MKSYVVTEEQLKQFIINDIDYNCPEKCINDFFADKQPVEEIASGKVGLNALHETRINGNELIYRLAEYNGKSIKIYVQVKEHKDNES